MGGNLLTTLLRIRLAGYSPALHGKPLLLPLRKVVVLGHLDQGQGPDSIFTHPVHHGFEHTEPFDLVLGEGVSLAVTSQADPLSQLIHVVQMILPLAIQDLEKNDLFQFPERLDAELFLFLPEDRPGFFGEGTRCFLDIAVGLRSHLNPEQGEKPLL